MVLNIKNTDAAQKIETCLDELQKIDHIIKGIGPSGHPVPFLTRYAIIKSCGTIETCFKGIIADVNSRNQSKQVISFIDNNFRQSSKNPSYDNILKSLKSFDEEWEKKLKANISKAPHKDKLLASLNSLNSARNSFAHGNTPTASFGDIRSYFEDSVRIIEILEKTIDP